MKLNVLYESRVGGWIRDYVTKRIVELSDQINDDADDIDALVDQEHIESILNQIMKEIATKVDPSASEDQIPLVELGETRGGVFYKYKDKIRIVIGGLVGRHGDVEVDQNMIDVFTHEIIHYIQWVKSGYRENILDPAGGSFNWSKSKGLRPMMRKRRSNKFVDYSYLSRPEELMAYARNIADRIYREFGDKSLQKIRHENEWALIDPEKYDVAYSDFKWMEPKVYKRLMKEVVKNLKLLTNS